MVVTGEKLLLDLLKLSNMTAQKFRFLNSNFFQEKVLVVHVDQLTKFWGQVSFYIYVS